VAAAIKALPDRPVASYSRRHNPPTSADYCDAPRHAPTPTKPAMSLAAAAAAAAAHTAAAAAALTKRQSQKTQSHRGRKLVAAANNNNVRGATTTTTCDDADVAGGASTAVAVKRAVSRRHALGGMGASALAAVVAGGGGGIASSLTWARAAFADEEAEGASTAAALASGFDAPAAPAAPAAAAAATADTTAAPEAAANAAPKDPSGSSSPPAAPAAPAKAKPVPAVRYKGNNWSVVVPGAYTRMGTDKPRRVYEQKPGLECEPNCRDLQAKRTEESPLVARFGSEEQQADISVSIRGANTLKLTFLQIKDVTEFGDAAEAAPLFVPPGAKLVSSASRWGSARCNQVDP
jgi:hypothetical protein